MFHNLYRLLTREHTNNNMQPLYWEASVWRRMWVRLEGESSRDTELCYIDEGSLSFRDILVNYKQNYKSGTNIITEQHPSVFVVTQIKNRQETNYCTHNFNNVIYKEQTYSAYTCMVFCSNDVLSWLFL